MGDLLNEDWEEDGEPEMVYIEIGERLEAVELQNIVSIEKVV